MMKIRIPTDLQREIAEKIVEQSDPGYTTEYMGEWFAVDTDGDGEFDKVMHRERTAPWDPWHDNALAVAVAELYADSHCDFDPSPDGGPMDPDDDALTAAYEAAVDLALAELPTEVEV